MKIVINNIAYENAKIENLGEYGSLTIIVDGTVGEVSQNCNDASEIDVYNDSEELIAKYFILDFMMCEKMENRVRVTFKASTLSHSLEEEMRYNISNTEDILLELAGMVAEIDNAQNNTQEFMNQYKQRTDEVMQTFDNVTNRFDTRYNDQMQVIQQIQEYMGTLRDTVVAIQTSIASMPQNVNERFTEISDRYNALADRVAVLENKGV